MADTLAMKFTTFTKFTLSDFSKAIEINSRDVTSRFYRWCSYDSRGHAYYRKKDYDKAWNDVHKAEEIGFGIKISPQFLKALRKASGREK